VSLKILKNWKGGEFVVDCLRRPTPTWLGVTKSGKSTLINKLSKKLKIPSYDGRIPKELKPFQRELVMSDMRCIYDLESRLGFDLILNRSWISEVVYSKVLNRAEMPDHYVKKYDLLWSKFSIVIYCYADFKLIEKRLFEKNDLRDIKLIKYLPQLHAEYLKFFETSKIEVVKIDTTHDAEEKSVKKILRGVSQWKSKGEP